MTSVGEEHSRELQEVMNQVGPVGRRKLQQDLLVGVMRRAEGDDGCGVQCRRGFDQLCHVKVEIMWFHQKEISGVDLGLI